MSSQLPTIGQISVLSKQVENMVVRFNFERGKSCRYSTYTCSKQLGELLGWARGGHGPPRPPPKSATVCQMRPAYEQRGRLRASQNSETIAFLPSPPHVKINTFIRRKAV